MSTEKVPAPGVKYGKWTLIELLPDAPKRWKCVCDCGTERVVRQSAMVIGRSRQCGCSTPSFYYRRK